MSRSRKTSNEVNGTGDRKTGGTGFHGDLSRLLDSVPSMVTYVDQEHYLQYVNAAFETHFGISAAAVTGKPLAEFIGVEGYTAIKPYMEKALAGQPVHYEMEIPLKPGIRFIEATYTPDRDENGVVRGYIGFVYDITEKKKADKIAEQKIGNLAAIVHSSTDAIIGKDLQGRISSWNEAAERIFGYTEAEMVGQSVTILIPDDHLNEEPLILERLKKGEIINHFETKRITKDKKILDISLTISPVKDSQGNIIGASKIARNITEEKEAQRLVRESEERLRMAVQSTRLGTWEFIPATGLLTWSEECRKIYEVPPGMEVDYAFFLAHIHPEDVDIAQGAIQAAMEAAGDGNYDIQYRILQYSNRQPRWIRAQGKVFFNSTGEPERFIGTVLDITEEKTREQVLMDSIELFTTMADNVPAMIWMSGEDKFCDFFNKTWLEYTGRTLEQESNDGWLENVHPDDADRCIANYNRSFTEAKGFYIEYRLKRNDGQYRWIADSSAPRYNNEGRFVGFISACMDIDDQKKIREKIQDNELILKTISNAAPVGLWMTDTNAMNTFVNETWIKWTGMPFEQHLGVGWLEKVLEEDKLDAPARFWDAMSKREKYSTEFRLLRADGEIRWCLSEGFPYYHFNGEFAGYAGSVTDISELKKLEERKDDFIKMASHELKTPITSIKGYVQLLLNIYEEMNDEKFQSSQTTVKSSLVTISKQVSKLTRLISELLDLSRIESGKLELHKTAFDLGALAEETAQDIRLTTTRHAIIVENDFEGTIYGDKDRIAQVLLNLLTNAVKYSPDADSIEVSVIKEKANAVIKVRDNGIGIDKKDHQNIFERFYRVEGKSEQTYPGFGIGLFIANEIISRHDGRIWVESEKAKGSLFIVTLPLNAKDS
ncbi:MAG: PAS domain S-box protein [Chitinophagaceae bacterium]